MNLVDDTKLLPALIFDEMVAESSHECSHSEQEIDEMVQLPDPWDWEWETPLRAQMRVLSGRPDVTAWTADAGSALAAVLREPATLHRTLLGLDEDVDVQPPAVDAEGAATPSTVSADGDEGTS